MQLKCAHLAEKLLSLRPLLLTCSHLAITVSLYSKAPRRRENRYCARDYCFLWLFDNVRCRFRAWENSSRTRRMTRFWNFSAKHVSFWQVLLAFSGTSTATPRILRLSGGSCSGGGGCSFGDAPVTETYLPRNFGPHQGGVSVPSDPVPQVGL